MKKEIIPRIILLLILTSAISILSFNLTEEDAVIETNSYTKAICDETNYCQDYIVSCNRDRVLSMNPITGAAVQFSEGWQDPRDEETINGFCD